MEKYVEVVFQGPPDKLELIPTLLSDLSFSGFQFKDDRLLGFWSEDQFSEDAIKETLTHFLPNSGVSFYYQFHDEKNWNAEWEASFEPVFIGGQLVLRAPFHKEYSDYPYVITMEPKMAFGTGHHPTTFLMLKAMLDMDFEGERVLDYGCGTGVLAIMARLKGAGEIIAIDNNPHAVENTLENFSINRAEDIPVYQKDIDELEGSVQFDSILANITRNVITRSMKDISDKLSPNGRLLASGFFEKDLPMVKEKAAANGLIFQNHKSEQEWACPEFIKK